MKKILKIIAFIIILTIILVFSINLYVIQSTKNKIINLETSTLEDVDCILILGAGIWGDKPSPMLEDRLKYGIEAYNNNLSNKIIVSGDHGQEEYDEVNVMKDYIIENNIPSENIFMDHAGFSTYDSIYRAKKIFEAKKIIIVTQGYHLYRALHIAKSLDIDAYGIAADPRQYSGQIFRELREILARNKDFIKCIFKPKPTYLGNTIPVSGNGNITNDKDTKEEA